jgi:hypothetical protein
MGGSSACGWDIARSTLSIRCGFPTDAKMFVVWGDPAGQEARGLRHSYVRIAKRTAMLVGRSR